LTLAPMAIRFFLPVAVSHGRCEDFAVGGGGVRFTCIFPTFYVILRRPRGATMVGAKKKILKI
jgi:hypothetical protein